MNNCDVINAMAAPDIEAQSFDALSSVSRLAAAMRNRANVLRIAGSLFTLNRSLGSFLNNVHDIMSGKKSAPQGTSNELPTPERMSSVSDNLGHTYRIIDYICELSRRAKLTNNSLTAGQLKTLHKHGEELLDLVDWVETLANPKALDAVFARAQREKESGEVYDLSQV
jgi:hypothetical protein